MSGYRKSLRPLLLLVVCVGATACAGGLAVRPADTPSTLGAAEYGCPPLDGDQPVSPPAEAEAVFGRVVRELPPAMTRVEAAHGRPFPSPVRVFVCADLGRFARFSPTLRAAAVMDGSAIILSPRIAEQPARINGLLVHELSHLHLMQHLGATAAGRLPVWFREGLAVFLSDGVGAERVTERQAEGALTNGHAALFADDPGAATYAGAAADESAPHMYYRQAGMFVAFLVRQDAGAFRRLLAGILDGRDFKALFREGYAGTQAELFRQFTKGLAEAGDPPEWSAGELARPSANRD